MKSIIHYSIAFVLFIAVFFSLLIMNLISFIMLLRVNKKEDEATNDSYFFAGYELCQIIVLKRLSSVSFVF